MQRLFQKLDFPFMQQIDKYLLLNFPSIWATKIHYLAFALSLYTLALRAIAAIYPVSYTQIPNIEIHYIVSFLPLFVIFVVWVYQLTLFKVERLFGFTSFKQQFHSQALIMAGVCMFLLPSSFYSGWVANRVEALISPAQLNSNIEDVTLIGAMLGNQVDLSSYTIGFDAELRYGTSRMSKAITQAVADPTILQRGINTCNKWSSADNQIQYSAEQLKSRYFELLANSRLVDDINSPIYNLKDNIKAASKILNIRPFSFHWEFNVSCLLMAFGLSMFLFLFLKIEMRLFLLSIVVGILSTMLFSFLSILITSVLRGDEEILVNTFFWGGLFMLLRVGYSSSNTQKYLLTKKIAIALSSVLVAFIPLSVLVILDISPSDIIDFLDSGSNGFFHDKSKWIEFWLVFVSLMISFLSWNFFFNPKLQALSASPSQN